MLNVLKAVGFTLAFTLPTVKYSQCQIFVNWLMK
jgi:hypothetical protein